MRQYDDSVEVRCGAADEERPEQFLWRGRLWKVRAVLAQWVETPPWWQGSRVRELTGDAAQEPAQESAPDSTGDLVADRECWRVEAGTGAGWGVFDLALDRRNGSWQLVGCAD